MNPEIFPEGKRSGSDRKPRIRFNIVRTLSGKPLPKDYDPIRAQAWHLLEQEGIKLPAKGLEQHLGWVKMRDLLGRMARTKSPEDARDLDDQLGRLLNELRKKYGKKR